MTSLILAGLLFFQSASAAADPVALFQAGKLKEAESALRADLSRSPGDARSLMLLAVVLDAQQRYPEAEALYRRAASAAPNSAAVWNNFGNHWLTRGRNEDAQHAFEKVLSLEPSHPNANLQLARILVNKNQARNALALLEKVGADQSSDPAVLALYGRSLAESGQYDRAEPTFARALEQQPSDFSLRVSLGLAALNAGHLDRAAEVYEIAHKQHPDDPDVLYGLARANIEAGRLEPALLLLADARRVGPNREDILALLARAASLAGFHADAAEAWTEFLKLNPNSEIARRERAFAQVRSGTAKAGIPELEAYAAKHPNDPIGRFELGIAYSTADLKRSAAELSRAIALKPDFAEALYARGSLAAQDGRSEEALPDLERAVTLSPENAVALDRLGQVYRSLKRTADAERVLRKAIALSPNSGAINMHLALVLRDAGKREESGPYFAKFKELGGDENRLAHRGLLDFLSLRGEQRREHYIAGLRRGLEDRPSDQPLRLRLGQALLEDPKTAAEAASVFAQLTDPAVLKTAASALIDAGRYEDARILLERSRIVSVEYAEAMFRTAGAQAGLSTLDRIPPQQRTGEYWLTRAQMLEGAGRIEDAVRDLNQAIASAPNRPGFYHEAAMMLARNGHAPEAAKLLSSAVQRIPGDAQLQLDRAAVLDLSQQFEEARTILSNLEKHWPEWPRPWLVHGASFTTRGKAVEALPFLENAAALGEDSAELHFYLAETLSAISPDQRARALQEVNRALEITPDDPFALSLAGQLEHESGNEQQALERLQRSVKLMPNLAQAHYQLVRVYQAMGRKQDAVAESDIVKRLRSEGSDADQILRPQPIR